MPEMIAQGGRMPAGLVGRANWFSADTACPIGPGTWDAARRAAAEEAAVGRTAHVLCCPLGRHATAARAGGHCHINNAAIAAKLLRGWRGWRAWRCSTSPAITGTARRTSAESGRMSSPSRSMATRTTMPLVRRPLGRARCGARRGLQPQPPAAEGRRGRRVARRP
jgi:hypothetical protein